MIVMVRFVVVLPMELLAVTLYVPVEADCGIPLMTPVPLSARVTAVLFSVRPGGSAGKTLYA